MNFEGGRRAVWGAVVVDIVLFLAKVHLRVYCNNHFVRSVNLSRRGNLKISSIIPQRFLLSRIEITLYSFAHESCRSFRKVSLQSK